MASFDKAAKEVKNLKASPTNDEMLELYGLFKVGSKNDIKAATKPGMFDLKGKAKYNKWQETVDEGLSADQAQKKYVTLVGTLKTKYGYAG
ncbi:hypothetical protein MMC25_006604 [Agyrium rufum]|nr:hypothetical protein [Agyrium rufum]